MFAHVQRDFRVSIVRSHHVHRHHVKMEELAPLMDLGILAIVRQATPALIAK